MKHYLFLLLMLLTFASCSANEPEKAEQPQPVQLGEGGGSDYFSGKKVLIAFFPGVVQPDEWRNKYRQSPVEICLKSSRRIPIRHHTPHVLKLPLRNETAMPALQFIAGGHATFSKPVF